MAKYGKRTTAARAAFAGKSMVTVEEAVALIKSVATAKFDESLEIAMNLGVDPRHADQMVRGTVNLPNGTGKSVRVAVFARGPKAEEALAAGADVVHFDVMDNHFVPNLTIGPLVCDALRKHGVTAPIDVHLMIEPVDRIIPDFAQAGANFITFHPEGSVHIDRTLQLIHDEGCKAGLVFNPGTPLHHLDHVMDKLDMILLMSVNPGFGGQSFLPSALDKLRQVRKKIDDSGFDIRLEIDGGVKIDNIREIKAAGADTFVAGSAIFGKPNYRDTIDQMRSELAQAE